MEPINNNSDLQSLMLDVARQCHALSADGSWAHDAIEKVVECCGHDSSAEYFDAWQRQVVSSAENCSSAATALSDVTRSKLACLSPLKVLAYFFAKQSYQVRSSYFAENFAWCCIACLKVTGEVKVLSLSSLAFRRAVVRDLLSIALPRGCRNANVISRIAGHYAVAILGDDANLTKVYEKARRDYLDSPDEEDRIVEFGWTIFDCLNQSIRLKNVKLTRFFAKDLSLLKLPNQESTAATSEDSTPVAKLAKGRIKLLKKADDIISGLGQVRDLVQDRNWQAALKACDLFLEDYPRSQEGWLLRSKILGELHDFDGALKGYWEYFSTFSHDPDALNEYVWFVVRTFASFRPCDPEWRKLNVGVAGVSAFLSQVLARFDLVAESGKPDKAYSALLNSVTRVCGAMMSGRYSRLASQYVMFVERWDLRNLSAVDDKEWTDASNRAHPSLRTRVADALVRALPRLTKSDSVNEHPVIREFVTKTLERPGVLLPPKLKWQLPSFYELLGDTVAARRHAVELVALFPTSGSAWLILGNTYPEKSEERLSCYCKSCMTGSPEERSMRERVAGFGAKASQKDGHTSISDDLLSAIRERGIPDERIESFVAEMASQAERLSFQHGNEVVGLVLTSFLDKHEGKMRYRLWWPCGRDIPEGQAFVTLDEFGKGAEAPVPGTPILIQLVRIEGKQRPIRAKVRKAALWDGYPLTSAIVCSQDKSRGFVRIVTQHGDGLWADHHVCPNLAKVVPGAGCKVGLLKRQGGFRVLFGMESDEALGMCTDYVKTFLGNLSHQNGSPGGFVEDVSLPRELVRGIPLETFVKGTAVRVVSRQKRQLPWLAVTVERPNMDKKT